MRQAAESKTMINRVIDYCAHNRFTVFLFVGVVVVAGLWSMQNIALDAIPDLSDTQVIVYSRWDRSPDVIEDQVTYPIVAALLGTPRVKVIRGFSDFGYSYVYVIFQDGTDLYWARSRVLEYLSKIQPRRPPARARWPRVHGPRPRVPEAEGRPRGRRAQGRRHRDAGSRARRCLGGTGSGNPPRCERSRRPGRRRRRRSRHAPGRERARR